MSAERKIREQRIGFVFQVRMRTSAARCTPSGGAGGLLLTVSLYDDDSVATRVVPVLELGQWFQFVVARHDRALWRVLF